MHQLFNEIILLSQPEPSRFLLWNNGIICTYTNYITSYHMCNAFIMSFKQITTYNTGDINAISLERLEDSAVKPKFSK